jgi:predicted hydrocarbon binding protein
MHPALSRLIVRAGLVGGSLASGTLFWVKATLGRNQLAMHDVTATGEISIGGVSEQLYGEGFVAAWHEVLERDLGVERAAEVLYEVGVKGARWEVSKAIEQGVWVPWLMKGLVGRKALLEKVRGSAFYNALAREAVRILFRMVMTEGGWGVVESFDLRATPIKVVVSNSPETRRLGLTGRPSCDLARGIYAGYMGTLFGVPASARETTCVSRGDARCTFEVTLPTGVRAEAPATSAAHSG